MNAYCLIRPLPHYRLDAFVAGLKAAGYQVTVGVCGKVNPGDVLLIWNRYGSNEQLADDFERRGGTVLVAENGYIGRDAAGRQHYALAIHGHNGRGQWHPGGTERWVQLGIELKPWRADGEHILVCPNRPFGMRGFEMPVHWARDTVERLRRHTKRPIRVRPHPGNWQQQTPQVPLAEDLANAWAVVVWSSSAGVHALAAGIPVWCTAPWWILKPAAQDDLRQIEHRPDMRPDRFAAFSRLAWAQWTVDEIARGDAFRHLLRHPGQG